MAVVESCLTILGATSSLTSIHSWFTGFKMGEQLRMLLNEQVVIRSKIERLSEHILHAPSIQQVISIKETSNQISKLRDLKNLLEPIQDHLKEDILATAVLSTPSKLKKAFQEDPWKVLLEIRPIARIQRPTNPDLVPILFTDTGITYVGWQTTGALPLLFDCNYSPNLSSDVKKMNFCQGEENTSNNHNSNSKNLLNVKSKKKAILKTIRDYWFFGQEEHSKPLKQTTVKKQNSTKKSEWFNEAETNAYGHHTNIFEFKVPNNNRDNNNRVSKKKNKGNLGKVIDLKERQVEIDSKKRIRNSHTKQNNLEQKYTKDCQEQQNNVVNNKLTIKNIKPIKHREKYTIATHKLIGRKPINDEFILVSIPAISHQHPYCRAILTNQRLIIWDIQHEEYSYFLDKEDLLNSNITFNNNTELEIDLKNGGVIRIVLYKQSAKQLTDMLINICVTTGNH